LKATLHEVRGRLHAVGGEIRFDLDTGAVTVETELTTAAPE
jgi:hypothetical protein